ncbi:MAG: TIGR02679 family protein [Pseudonocardiaceae bacterium]|nr:TIGR02679 family protein [Pseudonocardiaceae bacterium]
MGHSSSLPADGAGWERVLAAARRRLEGNGGRLDGSVGLTDPADAERRVVIGLTGKHRPPGTRRLSVSLSELDAGLRRSHGAGLVEVLTERYGPLRDRQAEHAEVADARTAALDAAAVGGHAGQPWHREWLAELAADGTATRLVRRGESQLLAQAGAVLERLPSAGVPLPVLAEQVTGDPKALSGTTLASLVLRALALREGVPAPTAGEQRRALWDTAGVVVDDLASQVLVLNLPAGGGPLGNWMSEAAGLGVPLRVTLQQLTVMPPQPRIGEVFVCENPAVLRQAAAELGPHSRPLVCTEGVPSLACWRLLDAARERAALHWRNDFDWPGLRMTANAVTRLAATPWRMGADDYSTALERGDAGHLRGPTADSPWDPELATRMAAAGRAVMEERLVGLLLGDLSTA